MFSDIVIPQGGEECLLSQFRWGGAGGTAERPRANYGKELRVEREEERPAGLRYRAETTTAY